jgi:uncharacterized membrane protein YdfJ with MMPL/SSD domain
MFNRSHRVSLLRAIPVFAAMALLAPAASVLAQKKTKAPTKHSNEELVASIVKLHAIKHTLEKADHDYGGHRAAAVTAVKGAAHELKLALEHANKGKSAPKNTKDVGSGNPTQILSNKELAASIPALKHTHNVLQQGDNDYGGHRAKAVTELSTAITQLEKALVYIKGKNPK